VGAARAGVDRSGGKSREGSRRSRKAPSVVKAPLLRLDPAKLVGCSLHSVNNSVFPALYTMVCFSFCTVYAGLCIAQSVYVCVCVCKDCQGIPRGRSPPWDTWGRTVVEPHFLTGTGRIAGCLEGSLRWCPGPSKRASSRLEMYAPFMTA